MSEAMKAAGLGEIDPNLLEEAFRRAMRSPDQADADPSAVLAAIFAEARAGTRPL
jgi:glycine/D-amino acid oxidase-like deaminating enzyme